MITLEKTNISWKNNSRIKKLVRILATCGYIGYIKKYPSCIGSLPGILLFLITKDFPLYAQAISLVLFILFSIGISQNMEEIENTTDPAEIVIDETAGMWVALFGLWDTSFGMILTAFLLFRALDVLKPFPISIFQGYKGGIGVVADDVAAGMIVNIIIRLLILKGVF